MPRAKRQQDLPAEGMAREERPEIEGPAEDLRALRLESANLNERKRALQAQLRTALEQAGIGSHKYVDADGVPRIARIKDRPGVSVDRDKSASSRDDDGDDDSGDVEVS